MTPFLDNLIEALREELKNYGEMLALLDQQQERIVVRAATDILDSVATINLQSGQIQSSRRQREGCQRDLARSLGLDAEASFEELLPHVPGAYRPLLQALLLENNELLFRVQKRARQNHIMLNRSLELMQRFLGSLIPAGRTSTYDSAGGLFAAPLPHQPLYEAVG